MKTHWIAAALSFCFILPAQAESFGSYANGTQRKATPLPMRAPGILKVTNVRERHYGNKEFVRLVLNLGVAFEKKWSKKSPKKDRLQVGDLSKKNGGSLKPFHASHQNGLDVDIAFLRADRTEQDPTHNEGFEETFVVDGKLTSNFDSERNWWALAWLVQTGKVDRIFVGETIKHHYCETAHKFEPDETARNEVLHHLRAWPSHDDHFHLRMLCPKTNARCVASAPIPGAGNGCDAITSSVAGEIAP